MANEEQEILDGLRDVYGLDWEIERTFDHDGKPDMWKAVRTREPSMAEREFGIAPALLLGGGAFLRHELDKQFRLEQQWEARTSRQGKR